MQESRCKKCGKLLFKHGKRHIDLTGVPIEIREQLEKQFEESTIVEIVCKQSARNGKGTCNELNQIII
jgi:phage FluMu protein Com